MSDNTRRTKLEQRLDEIEATIAKLHDQIREAQTLAAGENPVGHVIAFWVLSWKNAHGGRYELTKQDAANLKRLVNQHGLEELEGRMIRYPAIRTRRLRGKSIRCQSSWHRTVPLLSSHKRDGGIQNIVRLRRVAESTSSSRFDTAGSQRLRLSDTFWRNFATAQKQTSGCPSRISARFPGTVKLTKFRFLNPQAVGADSRWEPDALGRHLGVLPST